MKIAKIDCKACGNTYKILFDGEPPSNIMCCSICGYNYCRVEWMMRNNNV